MRVVWFIVGLLALTFWGFAVFHMWAVLTAWPPYAEQYGADMFAWVQGFPLWRKAVWGASVGFGVIGSLMMLVRVRSAGPILLLAWLLLVSGFAYDVVVQEGVQNYGQQGVIASAVLIILAALFAWAGFAATAKSAKPTLAASSSPAQAVTAPAPAPEPTPQASPPVVVAPAPTPAEAPPAPALTEAPPTPIEAASAPTEPEPSVPPPSEGPAPDSLAVSAPESAAQDASMGAEDSDTPPPTSEDKPSDG